MRPIRTGQSARLDNLEVTTNTTRRAQTVTLPAARPWSDIYEFMARNWVVGDHFTLVGNTKSGKTTFAREALMLRDWVVVFATKVQDKDLYEAMGKQGYVVREKWSPFDTKDNRVIFAPPLRSPDKAGRQAQTAAFRKALIELFQIRGGGNWTVYCDEIRYLTHDLQLTTEIDTLYLQGRALGITMVGATQRPRGVPRNVFAMATWFALWRVPNGEDRKSTADLVGGMAPVAREAMAVMPRHEFILIDATQDVAMRGKVYTE